jgi:hypothetical protein
VIVSCLSFYILEPLWRVKMLTMVSTAISAHVQRIPLAVITAFLLLGVIWLAQAILIGLTAYIASELVYIGSNWHENLLDMMIILLLFGFFALIYGLYRLIRGIAYRRIRARIP